MFLNPPCFLLQQQRPDAPSSPGILEEVTAIYPLLSQNPEFTWVCLNYWITLGGFSRESQHRDSAALEKATPASF